MSGTHAGVLLTNGDPDEVSGENTIAVEQGTADLNGNLVGSRVVVTQVYAYPSFTSDGQVLLHRALRWVLNDL